MESLILLAAGYFSKVHKGPTVAIILALVVSMTEVIYNSAAFELVVNYLGFHIYISLVVLLMMAMLRKVKAKVSFVVIVLCFMALLVNLLSFWIDALGYDSEVFFEVSTYTLFVVEVLAILVPRVTNGLFRAFDSVRFLRGYLRDFRQDHRGRGV